MTIRTRIILVIIATAVVIIAAGLTTGAGFLTSHISGAIEKDMMVVADMADKYVSAEIALLKIQAAEAAREIRPYSGTSGRDHALDRVGAAHPLFIGLALFEGASLRASWGVPVPPDLFRERFLRVAMNGGQALSSTMHSPDGTLIMCASAPVGDGLVLAAVLPGRHFSDLLSHFVVYRTGHLFIDDEKGNVIVNSRPEWVQNRVNFIEMGRKDGAYADMAAMVARGIAGERGTGRFTVNGVPRICAFRPVSSPETWFVGVVAPLSESPLKEIPGGMILVGVITLILSVAAALLAANLLSRPYEEMERLREEAVVSSRAKSKFLAAMSHEIRTPMNAILGIAEMRLQDETLAPDMREAIGTIHSSSDLLLGIINDILDMSKIEAGKLELMPAEYDIASLINDTARLNMMRVGSKPIEFELRVDEDTPATALGDALRVKQILNNMLSNAFKYTARGMITLSVSPEAADEGAANGGAGKKDSGVTLVFQVSDTGSGMTEEQLSRVFDEYSRFNQEANRATEGTGLGMSITLNLVRMMHGRIDVESVPGKGSTFTVRLPQGKAGDGVLGRELAENLRRFRVDSAPHMKRAQILREPMPYGRVLIVDDVETNIYVARGLLAPYGLTVDSAESGFAAIAKIERGNVYDIVFMDHMMPKMDGMETTKTLRERGYTNPVVALTANAVTGQAEMFRENGFDEFISKPIDIRQMNAVLNKFVRDRHPPDVVAAARREQGIPGIHGDAHAAATLRSAPDPELAKIFVRDASRAATVLDALCARWDGRPERCGDEDVRTHVVTAHGLKSVLANVGEAELSALAGALEQAGREGNLAVLASETPAFLRALRDGIARAAARASGGTKGGTEDCTEDGGDHEPSDADKAHLREALHALRAACATYDKKAAKIALAGMERQTWPRPIRERLDALAEMLLHSNFKEIARVADEMLADVPERTP